MSPPGRMIDIGGRRLHVYERGAGTPAVIFESGLASTSLNWRVVQERIAGFTRAISYDRAGLGWSDPGGPPTLEAQVADLHALGVEPPLILAGHSYGALIARAYARRYPDEVAGLLLVDPLCPEDWSPLPADRARMLARGARLSRRGAALARLGVVGWCLRSLLAGSRWLPKAVGAAASGRGLQVMRRLGREVGKMPREVWPAVAAHWSNPKSFETMAAQIEALPEAARAMCGTPLPPGMPAIALTSTGTAPDGARQVRAARSGHWIHLDEPELVVEAARELVTLARGAPA